MKAAALLRFKAAGFVVQGFGCNWTNEIVAIPLSFLLFLSSVCYVAGKAWSVVRPCRPAVTVSDKQFPLLPVWQFKLVIAVPICVTCEKLPDDIWNILVLGKHDCFTLPRR